MIMYWTCYENKIDGRIYFYRDVYGRDKKILSELNKSR
jgi:murein L,D-transpeptidase YcbB/YkuD